MITNLSIHNSGSISYFKDGIQHHARFDLLLIRQAWNRGCSFEAEADGFGAGIGTMGDWSAIRDSSDGAIVKMLEKAMNFLLK